MASKKEKKIISEAIKILKSNPNGVHYTELVRKIYNKVGKKCSINDIRWTVWKLDKEKPEEIYKPDRGLYRCVSFRNKEFSEEKQKIPFKIKEENFYEPFATFLCEREGCTKAIKVGGKKFQDKWGTPDVIGKIEAQRWDIVKPPVEIISAEIKINTKDLITAFGQACAYKLFSHKSYLVIPKNSFSEDISKLDALCSIIGIGLVLFDPTNPQAPKFEIITRAVKHEPDLFYVNKYMEPIKEELFGEEG